MRKFLNLIVFVFLCISDFSTTARSYAAQSTSPTITTTQLPGAIVGTAYSVTLLASGGSPPYSWTLRSGILPSGLKLHSSTGTIAGTPTGAGSSNFTIAVSAQEKGTVITTIRSFSITVLSHLAITSSSKLTSGQVGAAYTAQLQATGGTPAYRWSLTSGALPAGLSLTSTGAVSGTPTSAGTSSFVVAATDSGRPAQRTTRSFSISAASQLAITSSSTLPAGQVGAAYTAQLQATGGTPAYKWSLTSGALPAGLRLASTGAITGTPTSAGTPTFGVEATDSGSPAQKTILSFSLAITSPLAVTSSSPLTSGQVGVAYTGQLQATGGTPAYKWSIRSGTLPAGLSFAASTATISGTPLTAGTSTVVVAVADSGSPVQTASTTLSITIAAAPSTNAGTTWYVRPDGGTRYSTDMTQGQCNGMYDVSYASTGGTGTNQNCAFNDVRYLWQDASYTTGTAFPSWGWVIAGGDTVIIRGSIGTGVSYRVGYDSGDGSYDGFGIAGNPYASGAPPPPSGTSTQHTRILGENYLSCHSASAKTQLHGGFGAGAVLAMNGVSYVDVACLDITDYSNCGRAAQSISCNTNYPLDDYATNGISWNNTSTNDTLTDIHIHGMAGAGMFGATGTGTVFSYIDMIGNASSGWNADDGSGTSGTGTLLVQHFNVGWNGCTEEYPIVDSTPYHDCTDDGSGGYGDGFGTATTTSSPGWQIHWDQGNVFFNTQDGLDQLHVTGAGSSTTVTRVLAYGNMGQQLKIGGSVGVIQNSVIVGNCYALSYAIPGTPSGYNSRLSDFCRAADTGVVLSVNDDSTSMFENNTFYSANATGLEVAPTSSCTTSTCLIRYDNNIFHGFPTAIGGPSGATNWGNGSNANAIYLDPGAITAFTNSGSSFSNNITYGQSGSCSDTALNEQNALCNDPKLTDEAWHTYGYGNVTPLLGSEAIGSGLYLPNVPLDYNGTTRPNPPSIGAVE
jgi:hypothetical protein